MRLQINDHSYVGIETRNLRINFIKLIININTASSLEKPGGITDNTSQRYIQEMYPRQVGYIPRRCNDIHTELKDGDTHTIMDLDFRVCNGLGEQSKF